MALIISGISLPFEQPPEAAFDAARKIAAGCAVRGVYLVKRSVDARRKQDIRFVYSVGLELEENERSAADKLARPDVTVKSPRPLEISRGFERLSAPPVIAGFGPAGMFAALLLARQGLRPVVLERGADIDTRTAQVEAFWSSGALNAESNVQFGEGGAGTFSDGKLVTRIGDPRCAFVLDELAAHGAPKDILWQAKPHIGTDRLREAVKSVREEIVFLGGTVAFHTKLTGFQTERGHIKAVHTSRGDLPAGALILAPGHSARDLFETLAALEIPMEPKPFAVGLRVEHLQSEIDRAQYGGSAGHPLLPRGEYQLSCRIGDRAVYTFCMCPGGEVVSAASEPGMSVVNGMSRYARDGRNANSALVVSVSGADTGSGLLDGLEFQRRLETAAYLGGGGGYRAPAQTAGRLLAGRSGLELGRVRPSCARDVTGVDFADLLPGFVLESLREGLLLFDRKLRGFAAPDTVLTGVESRTSSPLRILRGQDMRSPALDNLYPCGEGAGYAGGIVSAAVDGVRAAQAILARFGG